MNCLNVFLNLFIDFLDIVLVTDYKKFVEVTFSDFHGKFYYFQNWVNRLFWAQNHHFLTFHYIFLLGFSEFNLITGINGCVNGIVLVF